MIIKVLRINKDFNTEMQFFDDEIKNQNLAFDKYIDTNHETVFVKNKIIVIARGNCIKQNKTSLAEHIYSLYETKKCNISDYNILLEFSYILYDKNKQLLLASRDRFGVQPLYYYYSDDVLIISNELKSIKNKIENVELDPNWIYSSLTGIVYDKTTSPIKKIKKLPPAHYLCFRDNKLEIKKYWELQKKDYGKLSINESVEYFKNLLVDSVKNRITENIGSELSGGLDSSLIVGIAAKFNKSLHTFSHALPENLLGKFLPYKDEREYFNKVLEFNKIESQNHQIYCENIGLFDAIKQELKIQSVPVNNTLPYLSNVLLNTAKTKGIKTIFAGYGGDEGVSNQGSFMLYAWAKQYNFYQLLKHKKNFIKLFNQAHFSQRILLDINKNYFFLNTDFVNDNKFNSIEYKDYNAQNIKTLSGYIHYKLSENYIPNRMELFQQSAMHRGINYSFPLLDYQLVEFYYSLPDKYKFYKAKKRYLFKEAIKDFVPQNVYNRDDKSGATVPNVLHRFMMDYDKIYDYLQSSKQGKAAEYIDLDKMISKMELIKQLYNGKRIRANQHIFFNALMLIMYLDEN